MKSVVNNYLYFYLVKENPMLISAKLYKFGNWLQKYCTAKLSSYEILVRI